MSLAYPLIPVSGGYDCPICGDHFTRGRVHKNGEEHPICDPCVRNWDKQQPSPKCAVCRANVRSILSGVEQKEAEHRRNEDRRREQQALEAPDRAVAEALAAQIAADNNPLLQYIPGGDAVFAAALQRQEFAAKDSGCCGWLTLAVAVGTFSSVVLCQKAFSALVGSE